MGYKIYAGNTAMGTGGAAKAFFDGQENTLAQVLITGGPTTTTEISVRKTDTVLSHLM